MTREDAIQIMADKMANSLDWSERWINTFAALGVLKLDEPKSVEQRSTEIMLAHASGHVVTDILLDLERANLKIVEK
jgi:hypothetical protein